MKIEEDSELRHSDKICDEYKLEYFNLLNRLYDMNFEANISSFRKAVCSVDLKLYKMDQDIGSKDKGMARE